MAFRLRTLLLACSALLLSVSAEARDGTIGLRMTGEAFDGPPKFRLLADGQEVGVGDVTNAVDSAKGAKLDFGKDAKPPPSNIFIYKVPNIDSISRLEVEFTNDDWAGVGKPGDRNLYLLSLSVSTSRKVPNGSITTTHEFAPTAFVAIMPSPGGNKITSEYAALNNTGSFRLTRPKGGWGPGATSETASKISATPLSGSGCKLVPIEIAGFEMNAADLTPQMLDQLAEVGKALAGKSCKVLISASTGSGSSNAFRIGLSQARAQIVAAELVKHGIPSGSIKTANATGRGRRVVISFQ